MTAPKTIIMVDIETLDLATTAVVTQIAFMAAPSFAPDNPNDRIAFDEFYLPIQPQLDAGRTVNAKTLAWWMQQEERARTEFAQNINGDSDVLVAFVRSFLRKLQNVLDTVDGEVEVWAKGPQFDIVIIESLVKMCGEEVPWTYDQVRDLRTTMALAGLGRDSVDSTGFVKHIALEDCRYQLKCYAEAMRALNLLD